jgi:hypothetical protein
MDKVEGLQTNFAALDGLLEATSIIKLIKYYYLLLIDVFTSTFHN